MLTKGPALPRAVPATGDPTGSRIHMPCGGFQSSFECPPSDSSPRDVLLNLSPEPPQVRKSHTQPVFTLPTLRQHDGTFPHAPSCRRAGGSAEQASWRAIPALGGVEPPSGGQPPQLMVPLVN